MQRTNKRNTNQKVSSKEDRTIKKLRMKETNKQKASKEGESKKLRMFYTAAVSVDI